MRAEDAQRIQPAFYALRADVDEPPATSALLYECVRRSDGRRAYLIENEPVPAGFERSDRPLCRVWKNPARYVTVVTARCLSDLEECTMTES